MTDVLDQILDAARAAPRGEFLTELFGPFLYVVRDKTMPVVLFGAGAVGKDLCEVLQLHGVQPACFCDNNVAGGDVRYHGVPVTPFSALTDECRRGLFVAASRNFAEDICRDLMDRGISSERIVSIAPVTSPKLLGYYKHCNWYTGNAAHALSPADLAACRGELTSAYALLADQRSRDLFVGRLALFLSEIDYERFAQYITRYSELNETARESFPFYVSPEDFGYFNNDVITLRDGEVLVDGGASNGLSAATFAETCRRRGLAPRRIDCFEPEENNFQVAKRNTAHLPTVHYVQRALWSTETTLSFVALSDDDPGARLEICGGASLNAAARKTEVRTVSIDAHCAGEEVTFIKMDVEGAETEALRGAEATIRRYHPTLAISAYHKHSDIFRLLLLAHEFCPSYRFFLRHYGFTLFDMVFFAVHESRCRVGGA